MNYLTLIIILVLLTFAGSDWYNVQMGPQIFVMLMLVICGMVTLNTIISERKRP